MNKKILIILFAIFLLCAFLRLYKINEIPPGVNRDEASIGYTAYSLLTTGKDEYARVFPISFQSFGDWKLPLYIYLTVPFVWLFGLTELSVRLPSAIFGIATVILTYFLVKELFLNRRTSQNHTQNNAEWIPLLTSFLLAISPWHLHLSRVESESNTALFFVVLATLLLLKSFKTKWLIIPSLSLFALTYFTYAGNHVFTTLLLLGIVIFYKTELLKNKFTYVGAFIFLVLVFLILSQTLFSANRTKLSGINIFGDPYAVHRDIEFPRRDHTEQGLPFGRIFHNKLAFAAERFVQNYINSFSPQFLFMKGGDNKAHNISNFGNMYLVEAPFLLLGLIWLLINKKTREHKLILWWFLIAPIASSITKDAPHTNRMFAIFPILSLVVAYGMYILFSSVSKERRTYLVATIAILMLINVSVYLDRYYIHFPVEDANAWGIGYKRLNEELSRAENKDKKVVITRPEFSAYIYLLFYSKYDPKKYQDTVVRYPPTSDGFVHVKSYDRFTFRDIDFEKDFKSSETVKRIIPLEDSDIPDHLFDEFAQRNINWKTDFVLPDTLLVDYLRERYDSRLTKHYKQLKIIFTSYKNPMFVITQKR